MENKKEMLLYNAGGCLMLGEIMQRKAEQQKLEELEIPMFNPINADHNDKKKNNLHEKCISLQQKTKKTNKLKGVAL